MRGVYYSGGAPSHPEDIKILREQIPALEFFDDTVIDTLYRDFSDTWYCAGWMWNSLPDGGYIDDFKKYLFTKDQE